MNPIYAVAGFGGNDIATSIVIRKLVRAMIPNNRVSILASFKLK